MDAVSVKRNLNILATDMQFIWDKPNEKLYVTANQSIPSSVTIKFKPILYNRGYKGRLLGYTNP